MLRWRLLLAILAALALIECVGPSEPLTPEDRCELLCLGNGTYHPCEGETVAADCISSCSEHITPLTGDCLTCVLTHSGWIGEACVCQEVDDFGELNVTCEACSYTTHQTNCVDSTACTKDTESCEGFILVEPAGSVCSSPCGS